MRRLRRVTRRAQKRLVFVLHSFRFTMIGSVFLIMLVSGIVAGGTVSAIFLAAPELLRGSTPLLLVLISLPVSILLGTVFSVIVSKQILRPVDDLIRATEEVSRGNFDIEVPIRYRKNQFSRLIASFNAMTRELSGIEIFRNDFINNFSHEFKTPLSTIRGFARQLQNADLSPSEREEYIEIIISACDRLTAMSSGVLLLSKLENQQFITDRELCDIPEQLRGAILMLEQAWTKKGIELRLELDDGILYSCNAETMMHVWENLLSNAVKFCPDTGGIIEISCRETEDFVIVTVSDNGIGMTEQTLAHIFEKFYQGDTSHRSEGNGLGLPLVRRIVELYGGRVEVQSTPGVGSTLRVRLPKEQR